MGLRSRTPTCRTRSPNARRSPASRPTYLTTGSHHLVRVDDEGLSTPIQLVGSRQQRVHLRRRGVRHVLVERGRYDASACSPDGLIEYADQPLPGLG